MDAEIRLLAEGEFDDFMACDGAAFGHDVDDEDREEARNLLELDRTLAAFDQGRVVGTSGNLSLELTVPGGTTVPTAGVTFVSVLPTHRRRGVMTGLVGRLLEDAAERGEPLAALKASESVIYGRFGFGLATSAATYEIEPGHATFLRPPAPPGRLRLIERNEADTVLPDVFDGYRRGQPGEVSRTRGWWKAFLDDREDERDDWSPLFHVVHESASGEPDGYASYRYDERWEGVPNYFLEVRDLVALDHQTRLALLAYCLQLDLVGRARLTALPLEEPLRWALADPRRLQTTAVFDFLWVRLVDVAVALGTRRYSVEGRLVLEVDDGFRPENSRRYELDGGPDGAECRPTTESADLALGVADLGAAFLGGVGMKTLAAVGRVQELRSGALAVASAMFAAYPAPYCHTLF